MTRTEKLEAALRLALEYWGHRQQRYKNRHPVWVKTANDALATPPTSEWNEAIEAAAEECDVFSRSIGARCAGVVRQIAWDIRALKRKERT